MMLPEHKEAINNKNKELCYRKRIDIDDQELEQIYTALSFSFNHKHPVLIKMYDLLESCSIDGVVQAVAISKKSFKVEGDWFKIDDVEAVEIFENQVNNNI